jgi:L-lactate dehydrogenase complex protein LldE
MRDVALFVTCLTDQFSPQAGLAVMHILEHFGCRVHFPQAQTCCGQPLYNNGFHGEAAGLARRMIEVFEPYPFIVTPSASCCAMVREHFPQLLAGEAAWQPGLQRLVSRTYEFVEFLQKVLKVDFEAIRLPQRQALTYHYNCHLRLLGVGPEQADRPLREMGNLEFRPLEKAEQCCGFGGMFSVEHPAISAVMAADKAKCIGDTGAPTVICNEAGCSMNISGMLHRQGVPARVRHFAEVLAEALGLG